VRMRFKPGSLYTGEYTVNNIAYDAQGIRYYALNGLTGFHWERCLEPIPTETWRDVTAECEFAPMYADGTTGTLWHTPDGGRYNVLKRPEFRLRKVTDGVLDAAFIIEKREP
jgi:hypothetical protein